MSNRTSMESKPRVVLQAESKIDPSQCLIEPVWNQNKFRLPLFKLREHRTSQCLIEPVWNQNGLFGVSSFARSVFVSMSNRTSMESKLNPLKNR